MYYSNVTFQMEDPQSEEVTSYAQLWLLFWITLIDLISNATIQKDLAFVQLYKEVPHNQLNRLLKCVELRWEYINISRCLKQPLDFEYGLLVVDIANVFHVVHVVPNFIEEGHFFLNKYKF
jgi:hypothetical protein